MTTAAGPSRFDLIVRGGDVVDGTGSPAVRADVGIKDGRVAAVGLLGEFDGVPALDAQGCMVTPGFIDVHSHSDFTLLVDPRAVSSVTQGVTTEVVGNCGHGCAPIADPVLARSNIYGAVIDFPINWRSVGEYLDRLETARPAVNVATLVPNGNLRLAACGLVDRPSMPRELRAMKDLLAAGLDEGAYGFSTGLEYAPESACGEDEIVDLCRVTARVGGLYATHTRNRDGEARESIAEAIRMAAVSGASLQISHIGVVSRLADDGRWAVQQAVAQVDAARDSGLDVTFDMHTRLFGTTHLSAALPWALDGGPAAIEARLRDPDARRRMKGYRSIVTGLARGDWSRIVMFDSAVQPETSRRAIADIAAERGIEPFDAVCELLSAAGKEMHGLMILAFAYREDDLRLAFDHPCCMVGSDATALAADGPLAGMSFHGAFTWAAWYFRHFVRERKMISPEEAVRRMTALPAGRVGLKDRGVLRIGAWADLAVFDASRFGERGTTFEPNRAADGMMHVLVNGKFVLRDRALTGDRPGHVLRRC